jgi:hypothetical protein
LHRETSSGFLRFGAAQPAWRENVCQPQKGGRKMKVRNIFWAGILLAFVSGFTYTATTNAGFGDILKGFEKSVGMSGGGGLSTDKIIAGLKEALEIGTAKAVNLVSKAGGYYNNPEIRIPLPGSVKKVESVLRAAGYGPKLDAFELSMNQAAEKAAPEAKSIFWDSIKQMTVKDARKILDGADNEATLYFKDKTYDRLHQTFKPIVHDTMAKVGVTHKYQEIDSKIRTIPFADRYAFDLDGYTTDGALDGLFKMLAEQEKKIRQDPAARVTDLLKEVFGRR